jgi:copper resistance protein B
MNSVARVRPLSPGPTRAACAVKTAILSLCAAFLYGNGAAAQETRTQDEHAQHAKPTPATDAASKTTPDHSAHGDATGTTPPASSMEPAEQKESMPMAPMQGGRAPADARDPHSYAEGYEYTGMPGIETSDQIVFGWVSGDELEFLSGNEGEGFAWNAQANYGDDRNKLWLRTQGLKLPDELDPTTSGEALWWRPYSAFWGSQLGIRQDFGKGAHTYLAVGIEGIAPYWALIEATAYLGDDGRLAARFKIAYDVRFTNRLMLTPNLEANASSKSEEERRLGAGLGNVEVGLRLRYEVHRKFAPYVGYVWERSFSDTAELRREAGDPVNEHRFVAGVRAWF